MMMRVSKWRYLVGGALGAFGLAILWQNIRALAYLFSTQAGLMLLFGVAFGAALIVKGMGGTKIRTKYRRGATEAPFSKAQREAFRLRKKYGEGPFFGMLELPFASKEGHFCVVGATGSGKTVTIRLFLQRIVPELLSGKLQGRALIYDPKQDMIPILSALSSEVPTHILNPFDARSSYWDMAKDITEPATAYQLSSLIISEPDRADGNSMFFVNTMRNIMSTVIQTFMEFCPDEWTFRDVLLAMATEKNLRLVLSGTPKGRQVLDACIKEGECFDNIRASIEARISEYEIIAALWHTSKGPRFSLRDWLKSRSIAVLGNRESSRKVMDTINALLFNRLVELINDGPESSDETTWIILDEVRRAGKLDKLKDLLLFGRSKGASVLLGLQDVDGLREVYGTNVANEILGQCANKAILWLNSPETAKWGSSLFGEEEVYDISRSRNQNSNGMAPVGIGSLGSSESESIAKRELVLTSQLLAKTGLFGFGGIGGYYSLQNIGNYSVRVSSDWVRRELSPKDEEEAAIRPRDGEDQKLKPWNDLDLIRLGLVGGGELSENTRGRRKALVNFVGPECS